MSWAVGLVNGRWIGYGVPAVCDQPGCGVEIDRGLAYACGGGVVEDVPNCGLFFCSPHLYYVEADDDSGDRQGFVCARCLGGQPPFEPTKDVPEWVRHMLTHESWQDWRDENPEETDRMRRELA